MDTVYSAEKNADSVQCQNRQLFSFRRDGKDEVRARKPGASPNGKTYSSDFVQMGLS